MARIQEREKKELKALKARLHTIEHGHAIANSPSTGTGAQLSSKPVTVAVQVATATRRSPSGAAAEAVPVVTARAAHKYFPSVIGGRKVIDARAHTVSAVPWSSSFHSSSAPKATVMAVRAPAPPSEWRRKVMTCFCFGSSEMFLVWDMMI